MRFWCDGLGFTKLFDHTFTGDWPTLFNARTDRLRSIFLGDPNAPDTGIGELVQFDRGREERDVISAAAAPAPPGEPAFGFFLLSLQRDVDTTLAGLGFDEGVRRVEMPAPGGKTVAMAVITAPDCVRVELIGPPTGRPIGSYLRRHRGVGAAARSGARRLAAGHRHQPDGDLAHDARRRAGDGRCGLQGPD
jgi:hypothetical protein